MNRICPAAVAASVLAGAAVAFGSAAPPYCPVTNPTYRCVYTDEFRRRPQMGGFMLPEDGGTEQDFRDMAALGARVVRYHMNIGSDAELRNRENLPPDEYEPLLMAWLEKKLAKLSLMQEWTSDLGIWFVVGLHGSPGLLYTAANVPAGQEALLTSNRMLNEAAYERMFYRVWTRVAAHCRDMPRIYGYDLVNEPNQTAPAAVDYWSIQRRCAEQIRRIDPKTPIIVETNRHSIPSTYDDEMTPLDLPDIVYSVHMYLPFDFTHQGVVAMEGVSGPLPYPNAARNWGRDNLLLQLKNARDFQLRHGARMFVGEFSAAVWAPGRGRWLSDVAGIFNDWGWDWCYHAFREWKGWSLEHVARNWGVQDASNFVPADDTDAKRAIVDRLREVNRQPLYHATSGTLSVRDESLAVYFPFDDAATLGTDRGPHAVGTMETVGSPSHSPSGAVGGACVFGGNGYFTMPQPSVIPTGRAPFSVCLWAKTASDSNSNRSMVGYGDASSNTSLCDVTLFGDGETCQVAQFFCRNGGWETTFAGSLPEGKTFRQGWHSVVFAYDGECRHFYLDGAPVCSAKPAFFFGDLVPAVASGTFNVGIGAEGGFNRNRFAGSLDEVAVFGRALSAADAEAYHLAGVRGVSTAVPDGATFAADEGCTVEVGQYAAKAGALVGPGTVRAERLTVCGSVDGGVRFEGDLTLADGVCIGAASESRVTGTVTVSGGGSVRLGALPDEPLAVVPVLSATAIEGAENLADWTVWNVPDDRTAELVVSGASLRVIVRKRNVFHATEGTLRTSDPSLAVHYPFDDATALGKDASPHDNGTLVRAGGASGVVSYEEDGVFGGACRLASNGYLEAETFPASLPVGRAPFSVCFFAQLTTAVAGNRGPVSWGTRDFAKMNEVLFANETKTTKIQHVFAPNTWDRSGAAELPSGDFQSGWHSVVVTYDGTYRAVYLDGVEALPPTRPTSYDYNHGAVLVPNVAAANFRLGRALVVDGAYYTGLMDEVAVFDRALSSGEAAAYHAFGVKGSATALHDGASFVADAGCTVDAGAGAVVAEKVFGPGTVRAGRLSVTGRMGGGVTVAGDLALGPDVTLAYDGTAMTVTGRVEVGPTGAVAVSGRLPPGDHVLLGAASFSNAASFANWRIDAKDRERLSLHVRDGCLVLTVASGPGLRVSIR